MQAKATYSLCRLALDGLETEKTAGEIANHLPRWRYEQTMRVLDPVAMLAIRSGTLRTAYNDVLREFARNDVMDGIAMVASCYRANADWSLGHEAFVRRVMQGEGLRKRTPYDDDQVVSIPAGVDESKWLEQQVSDPETVQRCQVDAALLLYRMLPGDQEATKRLETEMLRASDNATKTAIAAVLDPRSQDLI